VFFPNDGFAFGVELFKDFTIFTQDFVDAGYEYFVLAFNLVVVSVSALVAAEFFVAAPHELFTAV
jgi:hypothetical protein